MAAPDRAEELARETWLSLLHRASGSSVDSDHVYLIESLFFSKPPTYKDKIRYKKEGKPPADDSISYAETPGKLAWCCRPVIPTTQETKAGGFQVQGQPRQLGDLVSNTKIFFKESEI